MPHIYLKVTIEKTDVLKTLIFLVQKICPEFRFWGA